VEIRLCDLLLCDFFSASKVLAGENGLSNLVTSVTVLDSPDAPRYMKGGELVITTAYSLLNDPEAQRKVVENLAKSGAAGLGIKLRFFNQQLPQVIKETADRHNFPVVNIRDDYAYSDIYEFVSSNLISRVTKEVKRTEEVIREITGSIAKNGLPGLVKSLYQWTGLSAMVIYGEQRCTYPAEAIPRSFPLETTHWRQKDRREKAFSNIDNFYWESGDGCLDWLAAPIGDGINLRGQIILLQANREYVKEDYLLLDCAASACAMEIKRLNSIVNVQRKYRKAFLDNLLCGCGWNEAKYQAEELGFSLPEEGIAAFISFNPETVNVFDDTCLDVIDSLVAGILGSQTVFGPVEKEAVLIFIPSAQENFMALINKLYEQLRAALNDSGMIIGIGRAATFVDVSKSFAEAKSAIKIGSFLNLNPKIYSFSGLGFYRLLKLPDVDAEIARYYDDYLRPLQKKELNKDSVLIKTLACFIENGYSYQDTAKIMYLHPNTVRYRIANIEKLCRVNLKYADDRLNMEIALKILPLLNP
jgi:purine catabolism regulator